MSAEPLVSHSTAQVVRSGPAGPWRWSQVWRDVLFVHWKVSAKKLQELLPPGLELDTWEGQAWASAVAFRLQNMRLRGFPSIWPVANLLELNLRTYVRCHGEPGIFFLSMHADNRLAIAFARRLTPLPYQEARINYTGVDERTFQVSTSREPLLTAEFKPLGECREAHPDSLDAWLLERYRAFVPNRRGELLRMMVEHPPWQIQDATLNAAALRLGEPWGIDLAGKPDLCHFSSGLSAHLWPFAAIEHAIFDLRVDTR